MFFVFCLSKTLDAGKDDCRKSFGRVFAGKLCVKDRAVAPQPPQSEVRRQRSGQTTFGRNHAHACFRLMIFLRYSIRQGNQA
ncbi:MAG: hypothetical protein FWD31_14930, partial [Planctomycetaceae bacterium]|nr:hypothetical protein [Planctomycetaceae bacterium]